MKHLVLLLALTAAPAAAQLSPDQLGHVATRPPVGARLPAGVRLVDEQGRKTTLARVAGGRPLALVFADYDCPHVCGPGLVLTAAALAETGLQPGRGYRLAVVGLDPRDDARTAERMRERIAPPALARDTALLRGDAAAVRAATGALGYAYAYDAGGDQFAHDASVQIFGGDGHLRAVLPELGLRPETLRAALTGSAPGEPLSWGDHVARLCYGLAAAHGRYGRAVAIGLPLLTLALAIVAGLFVLRRRRAA